MADRGVFGWARRHVASAISEGTLDGVLAAFVLSRYEDESRPEIVRPVTGAADDNDFSRDRTAILAVALERQWVATTGARVQLFVDHFKRLEGQAGHPENDPTTSPRLLWLLSRAALVDGVRDADPTFPERIGRLVDHLRTSGPALRDKLLAAAALGDLRVDSRPALADRAARDILGRADTRLTAEDAIAALWFVAVIAASWQVAEPEPQALVALIPQLRRKALEHDDDGDVVTALMADGIGFSSERAESVAPDERGIILAGFDTFSDVARRLGARLHDRPNFTIENEYDVQDLLYAMLKTPIPDLVDEEPTPKRAGSSKHIDFITRTGRCAIEVKYVRDARHGREVADEIRQDLDHYPEHAECDSVLVFVYDPGTHVRDAAVFERDLSGVRVIKGHEVHVEVRVRPR